MLSASLCCIQWVYCQLTGMEGGGFLSNFAYSWISLMLLCLRLLPKFGPDCICVV